MEDAAVEDLFAQDTSKKSLQEAFQEFRLKKMQSIGKVKRQAQSKNRSAEELQRLRQRFLDLLHKHTGIPYSRKNHPSDSELFNKPYELDCCALVRVAVREMEDELGIKFGPWNQAYMYDTLPIRYDTLDEKLEPGDLIFYQGTYYCDKKKPQKHNIVHVEVYDPTPENKARCFGSRWNDGVVGYFNSYEFKSTSWELQKIIFCSINTWLDGVCTSVCSEHEWVVEETELSKRSIFYDESDYRAE